jgi:hypothetical protein
MMNRNSLHSLRANAAAALIRFPAVLICAAVASAAVMALHDRVGMPVADTETLIRLAMTAFLGMLFFLSATVYRERKGWSGVRSLAIWVSGILLLAAYYFSIGDVEGEQTWIRFVLFVLGGHAVISFAPFSGSGEYNGFWQYNKSLFLRFLTSALYSSALYLGLALALLAVDQLFDAGIREAWYFRLWVCTAGIFNTWFFLAGYPEKYGELEASRDYPRGLKIFTQYVLLPLVTLYLGILYAYELKIFVTRHWPVGWVSYLVLGFSIAGILSLLLVWPVRNSDENTWINRYSRLFYLALFPLIVLLALGIGKRVAAYGITENRYFILLLAAWLVFIAVYFVFSRRKNIKWIPVSLCFLSFACSFGPWGAFSVSRRSQQHRLEDLLAANGMLSDGQVVKHKGVLPDSLSKEIGSVVYYLLNVHGTSSLQPYFSESIEPVAVTAGEVTRSTLFLQRRTRIHDLLGIPLSEAEAAEEMTFRYSLDPAAVVSVEGYDFFSKFRVDEGQSTDTLGQEGPKMLVEFDRGKGVLIVSLDSARRVQFDIARHVAGLSRRHAGERHNPVADMLLQQDGAEGRTALVLVAVSGERHDEGMVVNSLQAYLLASRR